MSKRALPGWVWVAGGIGMVILLGFFVLAQGMEGIMGGGLRAAESAAVSRLRTLLWAQDTAKKYAFLDRDGDGVGEYAFFKQLAGMAPLSNGQKLGTPLLYRDTAKFAPLAPQNVLISGGYCHVLFLSASAGGGAAEPLDGAEKAGLVSADGAEKYWVAYAWPLQPGHSGRRVFFINQDEEIWESANDGPQQQYSSLERLPKFDAALPRPDLASVPVEGQPHGDGGVWKRWKNKRARNASP